MGLMDWMKSGKNKKNVSVSKVNADAVAVGEMAAGNQSAATAAVGRMMAKKNASTKILMVQDGDYLSQVTEYALKMAQRLDCEIIALDVCDTPLQFSGERREREIARFEERSKMNSAKFAIQVEAQGVRMHHVMEIADSETVIARLSAEDVGIRYVLTKPDTEDVRAHEEQAQVPVFDLHCSRIAREL